MSEIFVSVERVDDDVAVIRLDRPKMNALSGALLRQLAEVIDGLSNDPPGAAVIWGGERIFAAGAEIAEFGGPLEARELGGLFHAALNALESLPCVTIAAIAGFALGGGCELAMAADFRIATDRAKLGQPEILLGIIPGGGGTQRLPRLVGTARAKELIYTGRQVDAHEALQIGLVDRIVDAETLLDDALAWARSFARGPRDALRLAKSAIQDGIDLPLGEGLAGELSRFEEAFTTDDAAIGIASFFENGPGKANFRGASSTS
jgi:enoyl-CoA hydratase